MSKLGGIMKKYLFFLLVLFLFSCENENQNECSKQFPKGKCSDDKVCVSGVCKYDCSDTKTCPDENYVCSDNICYDKRQDCSVKNPFGKCEDTNAECTEGVCVNSKPCSAENPTGVCDEDFAVCYNGICFVDAGECRPWNLTGTCPTGYTCDENGNCINPASKPDCTRLNQTGKCPDGYVCLAGVCMDKENACGYGVEQFCPSGLVCINEICTTTTDYLCSSEFLYGYCENNSTCISGDCYDLTLPCSTENIFGSCSEPNYECIQGECIDIHKECDEVCSEESCLKCPNEERQECKDNRCVDKPLFCSQENVYGICPVSYICVEGNCELITPFCSFSNLKGSCELSHHACVEGVCKDKTQDERCSEENQLGICPNGQVCQAGICAGEIEQRGIGNSCVVNEECTTDYCDVFMLNGYCSKICDEATPCPDNAFCYKKKSTDDIGVCLANCSVALPNSCNREDYICIPHDGSIGHCYYDCKHHECLGYENLTCSETLGYCE